MNANYTEKCMVGNLEANFQHVLPVQFSEMFTILSTNTNNLNSAKKHF